MSSQEAPGASESADRVLSSETAQGPVSTGGWPVAALLAVLSLRCGPAEADSGRNAASH